MAPTNAKAAWLRRADQVLQGGPWRSMALNVREACAVAYRPWSSPVSTWVVSYPKSGVTWLRFMVAQALAAHAGRSAELTVDVDGLLEGSGAPPIAWTHNGGALVLENGSRIPVGGLFLAPRVLGFEGKRVLMLVRDPRDVTVSNYYQVTRRSTVPLEVGSLEEFYLDPHRGLRRTLHYHRTWERSKRRTAAFHVLRYESLRCGDAALLARGLEYLLQAPVSVELARSVLERSSPTAMRDQERGGRISGMRSFGSERDDLKVRRAVVGGYRDELSTEVIAMGDDLMAEYDYPFGYCP